MAYCSKFKKVLPKSKHQPLLQAPVVETKEHTWIQLSCSKPGKRALSKVEASEWNVWWRVKPCHKQNLAGLLLKGRFSTLSEPRVLCRVSMEVHKQVLTAGYKHCQHSGRDPTTSAYKGFKQTKKALVNMPNE